MSEISFKDATLVYDGAQRPSVSNLNLTINDGEFVALVGPSGSGKSTTLRMIAGLEPITDGDITIGGQSMRNVAPSKRDIAMVFQTYALYPHMSVAENMSFALKMQKVSDDVRKKRVHDAAAMLDLEPYLDRKPKELSGGQRQRVAMGRAIVRHPRVFLMDEPLSNLDAKLRVSTRAQIVDLQQRLGTTTVYVTHDQTEAMTMADRIAVLADGQLQQVGSPRELYDNPGNEFVAGFLGSPSMNIYDATAEGNRLLLGGKQIPFPEQFAQTLPKSVVFGIRPEHLHIVSGQDAKADIVAPVLHVEDTGADAYIRVTIAEGTTMVVRGEAGQVPTRGDQVGIRFDWDKTHWFDSADRKALVR
ncbi:ABC transporter ATP-binding protein [Corynebacterium amycolatum]|uniref:ABC transporter ATP-binding protein n=1 Tax=Corynebacterium amycolatum TaxID=43765 RepID=UPI000185C10F|nr:ABC transporter ATP-binding protein [Corynebacterium amycolatum]EEB63226.1 ABC transporter, ATP-binding protein [Corynebacterium amycolatum SK46]